MRYAYYPGCSLKATAIDFNLSFEFVAKSLGIDLVEVRDWVCCGASSAHATSHMLSVALPVFNLAHAEQDGFDKVIAPCLACLSRFKAANVELEHDRDLKEKIHQVFDYKYQGNVRAYHPLEIFLEMGHRRRSMHHLNEAADFGRDTEEMRMLRDRLKGDVL